ncbi:MAG: hypothetical protein IPG17_34735 [Sandaracinaceae bacterium]|nr:hypothetical protein [Sandaracinaceae bacterium]
MGLDDKLIADTLDRAIDAPVYEEAGRSVCDPTVLGSGSLDAPLGFFGRDPGRDEVLQNEPFIGRGGRLVRDALHRRARAVGLSLTIATRSRSVRGVLGEHRAFKPTDNKQGLERGRQALLRPLVATTIAELWRVTPSSLGNDAFWVWPRRAPPSPQPSRLLGEEDR